MPEPLVVLSSVSKSYVTESGRVTALARVDATVPTGAITAVVGVSGSGKSTLLRVLAGHERPTAGAVVFDGAELAAQRRVELRRFRRTGVSYVSQRAADNVFPHLSLGEHGVSDDDLRRVGLAGRLDSRAAQLSGGELARAAMAIALARPARLLVVDEPTAELDRGTASALLAAMTDAAGRGRTFVVATHDPDVLAIADATIELTPVLLREQAERRPRPPLGERVLAAEGVVKAYGGRRVVDDASLALRSGEFGAVVGRSGSGKSTLLMALGGWLEPDAGRIEGGGTWRELAYVPQRFGLVPELTVRENVALPARLGRIAADVPRLLDRLALASLEDRYPHQISIGQQQRVAIARALVVRPAVLLVDEPTSHQDAASAAVVWAALDEATHDGTACLVATHEPDAVEHVDTAWQIEDGALRALA